MHKNNFSDSLDVNSRCLEDSADDSFSISISAPGKVILFGEHSVVYGKLAIAASLGLRTKLSLKEEEPTEIGNSKVTINLLAVNLMHCYDLEDLQLNFFKRNSHLLKNITLEKPELATHENLADVIEEFVQKNRGSIPLTPVQNQALFALFYLMIAMVGSSNVNLTPFTLDIDSDFSICSGLGSSASYMVSLAGCFYKYVKFKGEKLSEKNSKRLRKFSKKDLDLISRWAFNAERIVHGTPSGLDNTICTLGSIVEFRKNSHLKPVDLKQKMQILLVNSKIPKNTKAQVTKVAALKKNYPGIIDHVLTAMENVSSLALQEILKLQELCTSAKHSVTCQEKTNEVYRKLDDLVDLNQNLLRTLKVSHPFLDEICVILAEVGLHAKLTGGGGGGYVFSIIPVSYDKTTLRNTMEKLTCVGYETILTEIGGPGLCFS